MRKEVEIYKVECYIPVEEENPETYATRTMAEEEKYHLSNMQPENVYKVVEVD